MKRLSPRFRWLMATGSLLAVGLAALLLKDFVRDAIVLPVVTAYTAVRGYVESLPQVVVWIGFVLMCSAIALGSLTTARRSPLRAAHLSGAYRGRVEQWLRWLDLWGKARAEPSRRYVARRLSGLVSRVLALDNTLPPAALAAHLNAPDLTLSERARAQLQALLLAGSTHRASGDGQRLPALDLEAIVRSLEDQLEVARDRSPD
jgi:hypothetical protein